MSDSMASTPSIADQALIKIAWWGLFLAGCLVDLNMRVDPTLIEKKD
jgi:hypothetical protein